MRWHLTFPADTAILRFDEEALVFNPASWETHFLNGSAALVLAALVDGGARSVDEIVAQVSDAVEVEVPERFAEEVGELLGQFESLGLVSAVA